MPTAKLINGRTLSTNGLKFVKGVEQPVPVHLLPKLRNMGCLEIDDSDVSKAQIQEAVQEKADEAHKNETPTKPSDPDELAVAIQKAAAALDPEDEKNFTRSGAPDCRQLNKLLGYSVTAQERDAALGYGEEEEEEITSAPSNLTIKSKTEDEEVEV